MGDLMKWILNIGKVLLANGVNLLSGFGVTLLLSLSLPVVSYGDYAILLSMLALLLIIPNALNPGGILFLSNAHDDKKRTLWTLMSLRFVVSGVLFLLFTLFARPLSEHLHGGRVPALLYVFIALQALLMSMERQLLQWYQVQERFSEYAKLTFSARLLKICAMGVCYLLGMLTLYNAIILLLCTQFIAITPALREVWKTKAVKEKIEIGLALKVCKYTCWILLSQVLVYVGTRANIVIISRYLSPVETGHFGFSLTLLESMFLLSQSVVAVVTPRLLNHDVALQRGKTMALFTGLSLLYFLICLSAPKAAALLVEGAMQGKYLESVYIFEKLALGAWFFMVSSGPMVLLHRKKRTASIALIEGVGAATLVVGNSILLPSQGVDGAVYAFILSRFSTLIVLSLVLFGETRSYLKMKVYINRFFPVGNNRKNEHYIESSQQA